MAAQHTPGPWGLDIDGNVRSDHTEANEWSSEHICSMDNYRDERKGQREANARLIAAAPDLLKALEEIERMDYEPLSTTDRECFDAVIAKARAAIAAAKGE